MQYLLDQLPYVERIAGKRWFRRYVADPIPDHVHNLRGGYRGGLNRGIILTMFDFEPPFDRPSFPNGWKLCDVSVAGILLANVIEAQAGIRLSISRGYVGPVVNPGGGAKAWLLADETAKKGALYQAGYFPLYEGDEA